VIQITKRYKTIQDGRMMKIFGVFWYHFYMLSPII